MTAKEDVRDSPLCLGGVMEMEIDYEVHQSHKGRLLNKDGEVIVEEETGRVFGYRAGGRRSMHMEWYYTHVERDSSKWTYYHEEDGQLYRVATIHGGNPRQFDGVSV